MENLQLVWAGYQQKQESTRWMRKRFGSKETAIQLLSIPTEVGIQKRCGSKETACFELSV